MVCQSDLSSSHSDSKTIAGTSHSRHGQPAANLGGHHQHHSTPSTNHCNNINVFSAIIDKVIKPLKIDSAIDIDIGIGIVASHYDENATRFRCILAFNDVNIPTNKTLINASSKDRIG